MFRSFSGDFGVPVRRARATTMIKYHILGDHPDLINLLFGIQTPDRSTHARRGVLV
nr:hypothetical protein [Kibdelosporangium sp. MJ126-NF4]